MFELMSSDGSHRRIVVGVLITVTVIIGFFAIRFAINQNASSNGTGIDQTQASEIQAQDPPPPTFGNDQNDSEGYDGVPWGFSLTAFLKKDQLTQSTDADTQSDTNQNDGSNTSSNPDGVTQYNKSTAESGISSDEEIGQAIAKLLGVPNDNQLYYEQLAWGVANASTKPTLEMALIPPTIQYVTRSNTDYVFYRGQLAMIILPIDSSNFGSVKSNLQSKFTDFGPIDESWNSGKLQGSDGNVSLNGELFKRGTTNTRIFLVSYSYFLFGAAKLIYIPNHYWALIQQDMSEAKTQQDNIEQKKSDEKLSKDVQKIQ